MSCILLDQLRGRALLHERLLKLASRRAGHDRHCLGHRVALRRHDRDSLAEAHAWDLEARYLALGIVCVICVLSPERVVIGGGVMNRPGLLELVRSEVVGLMNGYLAAPVLGDGISGFVTAPALGPRAGVLGALALAASA